MATPRDDQALDMVIVAVLLDRGPLAVQDLLDVTEVCESDLHGLTADLRAAGLIETVEVDGRPGYAATDAAERVLNRRR